MDKLFSLSLRLRIIGVILCVICALPFIDLPRATAQAELNIVVIGRSVQGRPIEAYRFGTGTRKFVVVGATHGGPERNTQQLSRMLVDWFRQHPNEVPASVRLYIIPVLNPDGDVLESRQNANGVDLNRNMNTTLDDCVDNDWNTTVYGAGGVLSDTGGPFADSEAESRVIRSFLLDASAVVFIHSDAGLVFPPSCEDPISIAFAQAYAAGAGYDYARYWDKYHITGGMHDWARGIDLPAIIPELLTGEDPEFQQNLSGLRAVFHNADVLIPALSIRTVNTVPLPMPIWRFWKAYGVELLGPPLTTAQVADGVYLQDFSTARIRYDSTAETNAVSMVPIPVPTIQGAAVEIIDPEQTLTNPANPFTVHDAFARFYQRTDGDEMLGTPLSDEVLMTTTTEPTSIQVFEKGVIQYDVATNRIVRLPVVWESVAISKLTAPDLSFQIR